MKVNIRAPGSMINSLQVLIGLGGLLLGTLVYLVDCPPDQTYFFQGTFDFLDLAAIAFGTAIAYFVISATSKRRLIS